MVEKHNKVLPVRLTKCKEAFIVSVAGTTQTMELKKLREKAGLNQKQLSLKSGVDVTLISRLERGQRLKARYETIVRLARALGMTPEELMPVPLKPTKKRRAATESRVA